MQGQLRLVQLYAGSGDGFAGQLDIQLIGGARHSVHNGQIGDLAGAVCRGERNILADQKLVQLRGSGGKRIAVEGGPRQLVGGVFRCGRGGQGGGAALGQGQRRLAQRHAFGGNAVLLKPYRHIVIGEVGGLGETVTVVAGAGDIERHLIDLAQTGQIPFRPVHHDVVRAVAQIDVGLAGLRAGDIIAGGHQLHPVVVADLGGQAVAVNIAVQGVGGVGDIHVVDDPLRAVGKRQGGQCVLTKAVAGIVGVTEVYGKVIGAVVSAAHAADGGIRAGLVYREL